MLKKKNSHEKLQLLQHLNDLKRKNKVLVIKCIYFQSKYAFKTMKQAQSKQVSKEKYGMVLELEIIVGGTVMW